MPTITVKLDKKRAARLARWARNRKVPKSDVIRALIDRAGPKEFAKTLESKMEVDDFLRVTAVLLFAGAFDQLTGWNPHNYFLYHDAKHDR